MARRMGMDLDGPANDKSLYTMVPVQKKMTIGNRGRDFVDRLSAEP